MGDRTISYQMLDSWSSVIAAGFHRSGLTAGDSALVMLPNCLEALAATVGCWKAGVIAVPVVAIYRTHELAEILSDLVGRDHGVGHTPHRD